MAIMEGQHSFACWGAAGKLHEHKFATTDRGDALTPFGRKWRRILEADLRAAMADCPECRTSQKKNAARVAVRGRIRRRQSIAKLARSARLA